MSAAISLIVLGHVNIFSGSPNYTFPNTPESIETPSIIIPQRSIQSIPALVNETRRPGYTYTPGIGAHRFYNLSYTWSDAWAYCHDRGGHLAIINSNTEMEIVRQFLTNKWNNGLESWIGAHDHYKQGQFVTIHGESLPRAGFDLWESGEPNGGSSENCVMMNSAGKLNDLICSELRHFTCESPVPFNPTVASVPERDIPDIY